MTVRYLLGIKLGRFVAVNESTHDNLAPNS